MSLSSFPLFFPHSGWFFHGESGIWNVVFCNVTLLDVVYTYQSSRYITNSVSPKSLTDTRAIMSVGGLGTNVVSLAVDGSGIDGNPTYEQAYSWELSRQLLGPAAYIYAPTNVLNIHSEIDLNGSKLQLIPLVLFIGALSVFDFTRKSLYFGAESSHLESNSCLVLYISLRIVIATWKAEYVELAALHLSDPLTTVQTLYGHLDPALTWEADADKKFESETEGDRLRVGPVPLSNDGSKGSVFMVTKG